MDAHNKKILKTRLNLRELRKTLVTATEKINDLLDDNKLDMTSCELITEAISIKDRFLHVKEIYKIISEDYDTFIYTPNLRLSLNKMLQKNQIARIKDGSRYYWGYTRWLVNGNPLYTKRPQETS